MLTEQLKLKDLDHYCCPLLTPRQKNDNSLGFEVIGTATLLTAYGNQFIITAKHVSDIATETDLLYPKNETEAAVLPNYWIKTNPALDDISPPGSNLDLAIINLKDVIHPQYRFLGLEQISPNEGVPGNIRCIVTGYPSGKNKTRPKSIFVESEQVSWEFSTVNPSRYKELGLDPQLHLAIEHDRRVITSQGQKVTPPKMKGMSGGGGMWIDTSSGFVLTGIVSDHISDKRIVFGTRITVAIIAIIAINEFLQMKNQ